MDLLTAILAKMIWWWLIWHQNIHVCCNTPQIPLTSFPWAQTTYIIIQNQFFPIPISIITSFFVTTRNNMTLPTPHFKKLQSPLQIHISNKPSIWNAMALPGNSETPLSLPNIQPIPIFSNLVDVECVHAE